MKKKVALSREKWRIFMFLNSSVDVLLHVDGLGQNDVVREERRTRSLSCACVLYRTLYRKPNREEAGRVYILSETFYI